MRNRRAPEELPAQEALQYWRRAARTVGQLLSQFDDTTPGIDDFPTLRQELQDALTASLVGANSLVGHYLMRVDAQRQSPAPTQQPQPPQPAVPASRRTATPGYQQQRQTSGAW